VNLFQAKNAGGTPAPRLKIARFFIFAFFAPFAPFALSNSEQLLIIRLRTKPR
jgi:hypothetical protein